MSRPASSVQREVAAYMKHELGLNVNIPDKVKPSKKAAIPSTPTSTAATKNHKARQREKQKAAKKAKAADQPAAATAATGPSTNKNTLKNKRKREKLKAASSGATASSDAQSEPTTEIAGVKRSNANNTTTSNDSKMLVLNDREKLAAHQRQAEANHAKFKSIAASFDADTKWHNHKAAQHKIAHTNTSTASGTVIVSATVQARIDKEKKRAENLLSLYATDVTKNKSASLAPSDERWLSSILNSGTLSDRIAGLSLLIQDRPLGRVELIDKMITMAQSKGRRESLLAIDALKELFAQELMPSDRPLTFFSHQSFFHTVTGQSLDDTTIMYWLFEDYLKRSYSAFLSVLETHSHDTMSYIKKHALNTLHALMLAVPERERTVLSLIVNKLGDPDRKIASRVCYLLSELIAKHPGVRIGCVREIEALLYRPNISDRAQYYGIIWLNQMKFNDSASDSELARKLIALYFTVFSAEIARKGGSDSVNTRLLAGLLTGIHRAMPYAKTKDHGVPISDNQLDLLFQLTHTATFNTAVQALLLIYHVIVDDVGSSLAARFYRSLYQLLASPALFELTSRLAIFLNLLYKSVKNDNNDRRICAFVKRLLQVCLSSNAPFVCGALFLVSELTQRHPVIRATMRQSELNEDEEEESFRDALDTDEQSTGSTSERIDDNDSDGDDESGNKEKSSNQYDAHKRDPQYANAHQSCTWELTILSTHFHPSIVSWSFSILRGIPIAYNGDPLHDFTLVAFLDRFVFKNPKKVDSAKVKHHHPSHLSRQAQPRDKVQVSSAAFLSKRPEDLHEDEKFFHQYFVERARREELGLVKRRENKTKSVDRLDDEDAIDAFADQLMENEMLRTHGGDIDAEGEDELIDELMKDGTLADSDDDVADYTSDDDSGEATDELVPDVGDSFEAEISDDDEGRAPPSSRGRGRQAGDWADDASDDDTGDFGFDLDDDDDEELSDIDIDEESQPAKKSKGKGSSNASAGIGSAGGNVFASAEEFDDLLTAGAADFAHPKEAKRERQHSTIFATNGRGYGRGGRVGRGRGRGRGAARR